MNDRRNHEFYNDPTPYEALRHIPQRSRCVYICSPYRDNPRVNIMRARRYCRFAVSKGAIPFAPHLYFPQFLYEENERDTAMRMNRVLMGFCDEVWVFGDFVTNGMAEELKWAKGMKIRRFSSSCKEVSGS